MTTGEIVLAALLVMVCIMLAGVIIAIDGVETVLRLMDVACKS